MNHRTYSRRAVIGSAAALAAGGTLAAVLTGSGRRWASAQSSGEADLSSLGLPELKVTVTDAGYQGLPAQVQAGRYLVTADMQTKPYGAASFLQLPANLTADGFGQLIAKVGENGAPPAWYYQTYMAGGPGGLAGQTLQAVIDLKPGNYAVWADDPSSKQKPQALSVTGTAPADPPEPKAAVTIQEVNTAKGFAFQFEGTFKAGSQIVKIINDSDQPHFVEMDKSPVSLTQAQLSQLVMLPDNATPPPGLPSPSAFQPVIYVATQSPGATTWHMLDLPAGTYAVYCFVLDKTKGMPHAMEGMASVVTIQ